MSVKLVVFDMAGTTVYDDNNVADTLQFALASFGVPVTIDEINIVMGYPKPTAIEKLLQMHSNRDVTAEIVKDVHQVFLDRMISFYKTSPAIHEKEGVAETFRRLKERGIKIAIDSGFSRDIMDVIIDRMGWQTDALIDFSVASDEVENGRPYPDLIFKAMKELGIEHGDEVVKVGDTISDLQEGMAAGCCYVIGITTGAYTKDELSKSESTHLIENIIDVVDIVLNDISVSV